MSLAVDRDLFSSIIESSLKELHGLRLIREEIPAIPDDGINIVATGPLTSESLARSIQQFTKSPYLYYYDAISPIVEADSIDRTVAFSASTI